MKIPRDLDIDPPQREAYRNGFNDGQFDRGMNVHQRTVDMLLAEGASESLYWVQYERKMAAAYNRGKADGLRHRQSLKGGIG